MTSSSMTTTNIHFIGGEKGGVGKSLMARVLAQYLIDKQLPFLGFDTDRSHGSLVRFYGTVTPAKVGARVLLQVSKAVRPTGRSERTSKFATQFGTVAKRATKSVSRFSLVTRVKRTGSYRAFVQLRKGPLVSGTSKTVLVHATPPPRKSTKKR